MSTELEREMYFLALRERCNKRDKAIAQLNENFPYHIEDGDLVAEISDIPEEEFEEDNREWECCIVTMTK